MLPADCTGAGLLADPYDCAEVAVPNDVPVSVLAHVSINFVVKVSYSSPVILLSVQK